MQSFVGKDSQKATEIETNEPGESDNAGKEGTDMSSSDDVDHSLEENAQNQLVVYDLVTSGRGGVVHAAVPLNSRPPSSSRRDHSNAVSVVKAYTVQCANCYKWRLIPTKEKYEEIRENVIEKRFYCETASEWRPGVSCDDPGDIEQDSSRLWAIDKPNIARPPPGWQRLIRLRGEGSSKFADVYYVAPSGKRFRSMVEIHKYLAENPELAAETDISKFTFLIPKPLQEDYVKKRPSGMKSSRPSKAVEANPLELFNPSNSDDLHKGQPEPTPSSFETPICKSSVPPVRKRAKKSKSLTEGNIGNTSLS